MQGLFNTQLQVLVEALQHHLRLINSVEELMTIEVGVSRGNED